MKETSSSTESNNEIKKKIFELSVGRTEPDKSFGEEIAKNWKEGAEVAFKLTEDKFLTSFQERFGDNLIQKLQNLNIDESESFDEIMKLIPIFPCPILKSKLILTIDYLLGEKKVNESSPLDSSFRIFKKLMRAGKK